MNDNHFNDQLSHMNTIETFYLNSNDLKPLINLFPYLLFKKYFILLKRLLLEYYLYICTIYNKYISIMMIFLHFQFLSNFYHDLFYNIYILINTRNITNYPNILE